MALTAAEKQRRYRARRDADPSKRQEYLKKERQTWKARKEAGKVKSVSELSEREKRSKRKYWRKAQQKCREKKAAIDSLATPPESPDEVHQPGPSRLELGYRLRNCMHPTCIRF